MTEGEPIHWGNIDAETAKHAVVKLEKAQRFEVTPFPFDNVAITEEDLVAVKEEVEQKMKEQAIAWSKANVTIIWGKASVTKKCSGNVPGNKLGVTPGLVVLSDVGNLPWGTTGERGGIYTWEKEMLWTFEADCYVLTFSCKEERK